MKSVTPRAIASAFILVAGVAFVSGCAQPPSPPPPEGYLAQPHRELSIISPQDGATVSNPVTVAIGFAGEGYGGDGPSITGYHHHHHHHGMHFILLIDEPAPQPGAQITLDATHVAFPGGAADMTITLPVGRHQLQIVGVDQQEDVGPRPPAPPIAIIVQ